MSVSNTKSSPRLNSRDLINIGIYAAIYFAVIMVLSMAGFIPIMMPLLCVIGPLAGSVPFMLFLTKVKKFGMILIMSLIMGVMMILTGMGWYSLPVSLVTGLLAEWMWRRGGCRKAGNAVLACGFFNMWMWGNYLPLFINPNGYVVSGSGYGADYQAALLALMPLWMCPVLLVCCFVFGILGGLLGKTIAKKHFSRAGIA